MRSDPERRVPKANEMEKQADPLAGFDESDRSQIVERLHWAPKQRLDYLVDMIAFEDRARRARKL